MPDDDHSDAWTSDAWTGDAWMDEPDPEPIPLTSTDVLTEVGWIDQARRDLECQRFIYAAEWADLHPGESVPATDQAGPERAVRVGGEGTPLIAEFCVGEFAAHWGDELPAGSSGDC